MDFVPLYTMPLDFTQAVKTVIQSLQRLSISIYTGVTPNILEIIGKQHPLRAWAETSTELTKPRQARCNTKRLRIPEAFRICFTFVFTSDTKVLSCNAKVFQHCAPKAAYL